MKKILINLSVLLLTLLFLALLFEGAVRLFAPTSDYFWQSDSYIGKKYIPNKHGWIYEIEYTTEVQVNQQGFIEKDYQKEKSDGTYRIIILGDSFVAGLHVPFEKTFHEILETRLDAELPVPVQVINFGVSGFGTANELLTFREYGRAYEPDLVVLMFFAGNDIRNNHRALEGDANKPYFVLRDNELSYYPFTAYKQSWYKKFLLEKSKAAVFLLTTIQRIGAKPGLPSEVYVFAEPSEEWEESWEITRALLKKFKQESNAIGADFLLVSIPSIWQVEEDKWDGLVEEYPEIQDWDRLLPEKRIEEIVTKGDFFYVSLQDAFYQDGLFYPLNGHFTEKGHVITADYLEQAIKEVYSESLKTNNLSISK